MESDSKIKRVLYALHHYFPTSDGYTIRSQCIIEFLKKHYTLNKAILYDEEKRSAIPFLQHTLRKRAFSKALREMAQTHQPQIIHANSPWEVGLIASEVASAFDIPFLYEVRGFWEDTKVAEQEIEIDSKKYNLLKEHETNVMFYADHIVAISKGIQKEVIERGMDPEKITIIPNGIDVDQFPYLEIYSKPSGLIKQYNLNDSKIIGYIGSLRYLEGLHLVIQAMPRLLREIPQAKLLIVGEGPELDFLKNLVQQKGLQSQVIFTGRIEHARIREYYTLCDIMILPRIPTKVNELVSPIKILEAMAMGKVVLGSDVGGICEIIENGNNGFLFKKNDMNNFISKCVTLLQRDQLREKIAYSARKWVEMNRDWAQVLKSYHEVYEKLARKS